MGWIYSYGGGSVIEPDKKITINNPNAIKALDTAHSWIGTIAPVGVSANGEEEARNIWQSGNAAFMRNWPYAYALGADPKSPVSGKFDVTVLPKGSDSGKNAGCLGGWQLMISAYSNVADTAADLIRYLSSTEIQKKRAINFSILPTRPALYSDPDVLARNPFFKIMLDVFNNAVARPSTVTAQTTINCPQHFSKTSIRCSLAAGQPRKRCPRWKRSQTELWGKTSFEGILNDFVGATLNQSQGALINYQSGSRIRRPPDPRAFWRRYSA